MKIPAYLRKGNTIAITCPSGYLDADKTTDAIKTFESWGLRVVVGKTVGSASSNYFSAPDEIRMSELQQFIDDPDIDAIMMGRGGYGMSRIIDEINFNKFKKNPKWILGFSDITLLHNHLQQHIKVASIHSSMCVAFMPKDTFDNKEVVSSIYNTLFGKKKTKIKVPTHSYNVLGSASGILVGGNLAMISHSIGSVSQLQTKGKILVLEDIGEHIYKIDRMLLQLERAGMLKELAGLILGQFSDTEDTSRPFGQSLEETLYARVSHFNFPVAFQFPIGHEDYNLAVKMGVQYTLEVGKKQTKLTEI